jgi:hypothetical protein
MQKLALYLAVVAALAVAAFGAHLVWGDGPAQSASDGDSIIWGS